MSAKLNGHARIVADHIAELFEEFVQSGEKRVGDFVGEIESDLADLWTVPVERQERFLRRIELQALGLLELQRIETINTTKAGLAKAITLGLRLALKVLVL